MARKSTEKIPTYLRSLEVCCPRCLSTMIVKKSKFGFFFGCPGYPWCKGTRSQKEAQRLSAFEEQLSKYVQPPLGADEILLNPDAPSHVWYEVHGLRLHAPTATIEAPKEVENRMLKDSEKTLQESEEVAT